MPDMLTIGQGHQTQSEYRAQMALWVVLGAPLIIGCDIRSMKPEILELLTVPEVYMNTSNICLLAQVFLYVVSMYPCICGVNGERERERICVH